MALGAVALAWATAAPAFEFDIGDVPIKLDNLFTAGVMVRMQQPSDVIVAKSNLNPGLCVQNTAGTLSGDTCAAGAPTGGNVDTPSASNQRFVDAPGSYGINGDNGDLNFKLHDITFATSKLTTDLASDVYDFHVFVRTLSFFDAKLVNLQERHPDTTLQAGRSAYPGEAKAANAVDFRVLDYYVSRGFDIGDRSFNLKVGDQVLNWGESTLLVLNSLNSINPLDATRLRAPGFDVKELFRPVGMAVLTGDVVENITMEGFLQYQYKPFIVDPAGSFFSSVDGIGPGGRYLDIGNFGKIPEDPNCQYQAIKNQNDPLWALGSTTCYTIYRNTDEERRHTPKNGFDEYGLALKTFWPSFNNGTELAFYAAQYHSRIPAISAIAAQNTCIPAPSFIAPGQQDPAQNAANFTASCGYNGPGVAATKEPLPVDTMSYFLEYPKNIHMFGFSFNTTIGDFAWSGEYAYRPNLPTQIAAPDIVYSALQPALPQQDYELAAGPNNIIVPGRRSGIPDFVSLYRNPGCDPTTDNMATRCVKPGQYIQGYERLKVGEFGTTLLKLIGGDNLLGASQITLLGEAGFTNVFDMPSLDKLQFQGGGVELHASGGANGEPGIDPADIRNNPPHVTLRQNPEPQDPKYYPDAFSFGYRLINLDRYDDAFLGGSIQFLLGFFHDVKGTAPGAGQNFVEGRKQILTGVSFDYQSRFITEIRYTWFTGGGEADALTDRDNIFVSAGYQF